MSSARKDGAAKVADRIRAREKKTAEDGLVLTLLDVIAERDALLKARPPRRPITGGFHGLTTCPHCGREF